MFIQQIQCQNILTKSNLPVCDFSVNPYVGCSHACKYCYASYMKRFTNHTEPWGTFVDVKFWDKIPNPQKLAGKSIALGSVTDPYLPQEETFGRTRAFLEALQDINVNITILTKSDLVLRDITLLKSFPNMRVGFSINTLDESFKADMDKAPSIQKRLYAMEQLHQNGIRTTCFVAPIFPEITDVEAIIERVKAYCNLIWLENLNLRGDYKYSILQYIAKKHFNLLPLYEEIYLHNNAVYWEILDARMRAFAKEKNLLYTTNEDDFYQPFSASPTMVNFFYHEKIKKSAQK